MFAKDVLKTGTLVWLRWYFNKVRDEFLSPTVYTERMRHQSSRDYVLCGFPPICLHLSDVTENLRKSEHIRSEVCKTPVTIGFKSDVKMLRQALCDSTLPHQISKDLLPDTVTNTC